MAKVEVGFCAGYDWQRCWDFKKHQYIFLFHIRRNCLIFGPQFEKKKKLFNSEQGLVSTKCAWCLCLMGKTGARRGNQSRHRKKMQTPQRKSWASLLLSRLFSSVGPGFSNIKAYKLSTTYNMLTKWCCIIALIGRFFMVLYWNFSIQD